VEARTTSAVADYLLVSLGTGSLMRTLPIPLTKYWGAPRWAKPLLDIVFDGMSETVDYQVRQLMSQNTSANRNYYVPGGARRPPLRAR
jgi:hypothetical protein